MAYTRTGKVPKCRTLTGTACSLNPEGGSAARQHICSTMGISAANRIECTGRRPSAVSSILSESMPTNTAPASLSHSAASAVRNGCPSKYCSVPQCWSQPVWIRTAFPFTSAPANSSGPSARRPDGARKTRPGRSASMAQVKKLFHETPLSGFNCIIVGDDATLVKRPFPSLLPARPATTNQGRAGWPRPVYPGPSRPMVGRSARWPAPAGNQW
jgi:hypothetical protein